ncbi:diguanylate cyclase (GGDEF)-like protein [Pelomonas saccharophila]|uniref:histidine kinase n=1 Tax=Roseateles saccharophilus TaxID=304 RepID=A0ABU1YUP5_ROSSA|nr:diguanylate cyclase [Roseateles saccharophilus]MDR7272592.1 diguanylate cyclase (GGDEF)-like protein [Roseateles saccharophilus]
MNPEHKPDPSLHATLAAEVAMLERSAVAARAELAALYADLAQARVQIGDHPMHQLLEADRQLAPDALRAPELDALDALPNRVLLIDRMAQALAHARRNDTRLALLFLDLDGFKAINDSRGRQVGDEVLRMVGQCLVACVRGVDTVCRLGGDEFVLLLSEIAEAADAGLVADKLLASLAELATPGRVPVSASIGVSVFPDDATDAEGLVDCADRAMYGSKRAGGGCYRFFSALGSHPGDAQQDLQSDPARREERGTRLRDANEKLVLSAMAASAAVEQQEQMLAGLQTAARNKDEFLSVLGHELRNPLAPLLTTLDVLRMRGGGYETVEHATMRRHVFHMVRLVDDLQDVGKIASGKVELRVERVPIEHLALQAIALAKPLMEQRQQHFAFADSPERLACWGDPVRLTQCLSNLLINAAKYTPPGGSISLTTSRDGEQAVIAVKDDGRGISASALPDVFNLFFQERVDANSLTGGLGVGLALVRSLVALHAGSVAASSAGLGRGSEFVIRLPLIDEEDGPQAVRGSQPTVAALHPPRRVLIVDDNYDAADSLAELLRLYGHEVWVATHPVAALQMIGAAAPELALLDIGLPGMDGYELAALIRQENPGLQVALVALSGYGRAADQARSAQAGFHAHLVKPVDIEALERILQSVQPSPMPAD